jgi:hypothetical protein
MARRACKFRQREITRTIKAARAAGVEVDRVEIAIDGKIVVHLVGSGSDNPKLNTADAVLEKLKNEHGKS